MSQVTSAPAEYTSAWANNQQQHRRQPDHTYSNNTVTKTNSHMISRPVQRVDSFNTSDHSHETLPDFSTDSSFNFDHPTPVDSTDDNTFHTPEIDDLLWQQEFHENGVLDFDQTGTGYNESFDPTLTNPPHSAGFASHNNSLPSPQSTNISTPEPFGSHSKKPSQNSTLFTSPMVTPQQLKQPLDSLNTEMAQSQYHTSHLITPVQASSQVPSPIIQISKHSRGDSPARSDFEEPRIAKKRSASNLSQGEYFPDMDHNLYTSHLMPPSHNPESQWEEDEEEEHIRLGIAPAQRDTQEIPSFGDRERQQEDEETVREVQCWLENTSIGPASARRARDQARPDRLRSRSTGARPLAGQQPILMSRQSPGPGLMLDENSDYYYSSDESPEQSLVDEDHPPTLPADIPPRQDSELAPDEQDQQEPLSSQFFRRGPWQDSYPVHAPTDDTRFQPDSSSAAIHKYEERTKEFETASRAATWGTSRRRLSDGDMDSIVGENKTRHMSLTKTRIRERGISFAKDVRAKAREQVLKRNPSNRGRQAQMPIHHEVEQVQSPEPIEERSSTESQKHPTTTSFGKTKSTSISAALREATGSLAAVGAGSTDLHLETEPQHENFIRRTIRRVRSKSDVNKSPKSPHGVTAMIAQQFGGMPVPSLASPSAEDPILVHQQRTPVSATREPKVQDQSPVKMPLLPRPANVMPNLEGFRVQVLELNPGLAPYLIDRIAHDQVRRYKRLVKNRVDHLAAVTNGSCASGHNLCPTAGGEAQLLPTRPTGRETANSSAQFKITPGVDSDNEDSSFDGVVSPAAFPDGIPLPPTNKLPAKFECPLCFQVKSFSKPSDWTKHVHEDVQPFTCTFSGCQEPKSFKRKADWVRHENERHRHLEWWKCNLSECTHTCFRKDNFVQHLVREHKRKEPKVKGRYNPNGKGKGKGAANFNQEEQEFWTLVDDCRHEGTVDAKSEPCKFCGNVCASWKKLSVHVGKHMEQIAMPVLELAERRNVTKDTIISPVEPLQTNAHFWGAEQNILDLGNNAMSPYTQSGASNYQSSSAGHSPAVRQAHPGIVPSQNFLRPDYTPNGARPGSMTSTPYAMGMMAGNSGFATMYDGAHYGSYSGQHVMYPQHNQYSAAEIVPRTTAVDTSYMNMQSTFDDQSPYFSSPEPRYVTYQPTIVQTNGAMGQSPMHTQGQHLQTPVTTQGLSNTYAFANQQQHGNNGQHYYPS